MTSFDLFVGIDYSGASTPLSRTAALQVYAANPGEAPHRVRSPSSTGKRNRNWHRREIADWLSDQVRKKVHLIAGIDHGFSFPITYFRRYGLSSWQEFLVDFCQHWPTDRDPMTVDLVRAEHERSDVCRVGGNTEYRLTEKWSSSAKSVFQFDVQGSVAKSTHAGIPWLYRLRMEFDQQLHFWPYDGWTVPDGKSVIAEVYPSILRNRYPKDKRSSDQQDAYSVARWLSANSQRGFLQRYFDPPLTDHERQIADLEGWILGIS